MTAIEYDQSGVIYNGTVDGVETFTYSGATLTSSTENLPILGVFIAFTSGAYDPTPDWVEVTQYVRSVNLQRGRTDELEQFQGGKASVLLDNRTRIFDPFNTDSPFYVPAVEQRTNLSINPSVETSLDSWVGANTTLTRTSAHSFVGQWSVLGTANTTADGNAVRFGFSGTVDPAAMPVVFGQPVTVSVYVKNVTGATRIHQLRLLGVDGTGTNIETISGSEVSVAAGGNWTRISCSGTFSNADVVACGVEVRYQRTNGSIGNQTAVDGLLMETGSTLNSYFDGNTAGCSWTGAQNLSPSVLNAVPAYSNLKPRKQIKIVAQWNGTQYPMFRGFVSGFPVEWTEAGKDTTVSLDCFDLMSFMGAENISADWVVSYLQELGAQSIIRNDVKENTYISEDDELITQYSTQPNYGTAGNSNLMAETLSFKPAPTGSGNISVAESVMGLGTPKGLATTGDGFTFIELVPPRTVQTAGAGALVFWIKVDSSVAGLDANDGFIDIVSGNLGSRFVNVGIAFNQTYAQNIGSIIVRLFDSPSTFYISTNLSVNDSQPHCVIVNHNGSSWNVFVDGRNVNTSGFTFSGYFPLQKADLFNIGTDQTLNWGYAASFDRALTADEITRISALGSNTFVEPSDDRFTRLFSNSNLPIELLDIDDTFNFFDVQALPPEGAPLLPALQQVANSEGSVMFVDGAGVLHFWSRNTIFADTESANSQITFADDGTGFPYSNRSLRVMLDGDQMRNDVTVLDSFDRASTARSQASILENGAAAETFDTLLVDVDSAQELAQRIVNIFGEPDIDLEPFTLQGQYDPSVWGSLLDLDLLDMFTFKRTPPVGSAIVKEMLIQQVSWNMTPSTWECTLKGSARFTGWFTVGLSLVGGSDVVL